MRISDLRLQRTSASARASARIAWEDSARPPFELFFETDSRGMADLVPDPEAFVTACVLPAIHHGERRIVVDGFLCPRLSEGLQNAAALLRGWYGPPRKPIQIEASEGFRAIVPRQPPRSALYFTAGVDSSHLLHANRRHYPLDHPFSFAECLSVHGHLRAESEDSPWNARALSALERVAAAHRLALVPVRTNLWDLSPDLELVTRESLSSALAAAAHLFRGRWTSITLASGRDLAHERKRGTHPLLDPLFSTSAVEIRHDTVRLTRFERLRDIAANGNGVDSLIVCLAYPGAPHLNCGECEKCLRTMTHLLALGCLSRARTFPHRDVRPEMIRGIPIAPQEAEYWEEALPLLARIERDDLVAAIHEKLGESRRLQLWHEDAGWKGRLRRLDRRFLGGRMAGLRRRLERADR